MKMHFPTRRWWKNNFSRVSSYKFTLIKSLTFTTSYTMYYLSVLYEPHTTCNLFYTLRAGIERKGGKDEDKNVLVSTFMTTVAKKRTSPSRICAKIYIYKKWKQVLYNSSTPFFVMYKKTTFYFSQFKFQDKQSF